MTHLDPQARNSPGTSPRTDSLIRRVIRTVTRAGARRCLCALLVLTSAFGTMSSYAYEFTPSDSEWATWPGYCQAKYVWTPFGRNTKFYNRVSAEAKAELHRLEASGIRAVHHHCTGTIWLNRARYEIDPQERRYMLRNARNETQFTYQRSEPSAPQFAFIAIQMATIMHEQGEQREALEILREVISFQPKNETLYSALAVMHWRLGETREAKRTLLDGSSQVDGQSAEINYNLGLISIELGEIDEAVEYATKAYESGYPLPGLRTRLQRLGRM
jgi:tetratricopeptide (TPR) repeat protein